MARRKIVFVIVEGPSDEDALAYLLSEIYNKDTIYVHVMHGDITSRTGVDASNIVSKIGDCVKQYAKQNPFKQSDFKEIVHIVDMDGAYIPDNAILENPKATKPIYNTTDIQTANRNNITIRNERKRENINRLKSTGQIWKIPYKIYYMSCNLDHVLYNKLNSSDEEKESDAYEFATKYENDILGFVKFIRESDFSVVSSYKDSWNYITKDLHSLERHTNLGLCFEEFSSDHARNT